MAREIRQGVLWDGSFYRRKTGKRKGTWRDSNTGSVFDKNGKLLIGHEPVRGHFYGGDVRKIKKGQKLRRKFKT